MAASGYDDRGCMQRKIIHVDMDAFFASVEQRDRPELRGLPVVVGGAPNGRGVVAAASYEARRFGIRSAMSSREAVRRCPQAVFVTPRFERYRDVSRTVMEIFFRYSDLVEPLSLDEAYLDVTLNKLGIPLAREIAERIKRDILSETGLTASAGVAPNKFVAKLASDFKKPDGLTVIPPDRVDRFLVDLPVGKVPGVGPKTEARMRELGLETVADLRIWSEERLMEEFGKSGSWYYRIARGQDERPVEADRDRKSLGAEETFDRDLEDLGEIREALESITEEVARRLESRDLTGTTVTLKITYHNFRKITRSITGAAIVGIGDLRQRGAELLARTEAGDIPIRLLGLSVSGLLTREEAATAPSRPGRVGATQLSFPFGTGRGTR